MCVREEFDWEKFDIKPLRIRGSRLATLDKILLVYSQSLTPKQIAQKCGLSLNITYQYLNTLVRAGWLPPKSHHHELLAEISRMFFEGRTCAEIAQLLGVERRTVRLVVRKEIEVIGITLDEAVKILHRSAYSIYDTICKEAVHRLHYRKFRLTEEGLAELAYLLNTEERNCEVCGQVFLPKTRISRVCSAKCREIAKNSQNREKRYPSQPPNPTSLRSWVKELSDTIHTSPLALEDQWVGFREALEVSGLTVMQLRHLTQIGLLHTRLHPSKKWHGKQPVRLCLKSELELARVVYERFKART
ncbi:MAG: hypothetical protein Q7K33_03330 [Candidatus Berkelbacteria bacterium]|nr:hypothetical protein [Candidatus Berkelbacteria bacterium]